MSKKKKHKKEFFIARPERQPELELLIAIDKCAVFKGQTDCIKALDTLGRAADGRVRVTLLVTDMDYSEKTDYRDPAHIDTCLKKSESGYTFAKHIIDNRSDIRILNTPAFEHFIDVFNSEVLTKEIFGSKNQSGLFSFIEEIINNRSAVETFPLANVPKGHPLERFKGLSSSALYEMAEDAKEGVYLTMRRLDGAEKLREKGIHSVDDLSFDQVKEFLANCPPATALQALHDSSSIYHLLIRTNTAFIDAKNNAGEKSIFDAWEKLQKELKTMSAAERQGFGKKVAMCYISNDGDAIDLLQKAKKGIETGRIEAREVIPMRVIHANTFIKLLKGIADDLSVPGVSKRSKIALEILRDAKSSLNEKMPHGKAHNGHVDEGIPHDANIRGLFVSAVEDGLKRSKFRLME